MSKDESPKEYRGKSFEEVWAKQDPGYARFHSPSKEHDAAYDTLVRGMLQRIIRSTFDDFESAVEHYRAWERAADPWERRFNEKWGRTYYKKALKHFAVFNRLGPDKLHVDFFVRKQPWFDGQVLDYPYVCWADSSYWGNLRLRH